MNDTVESVCRSLIDVKAVHVSVSWLSISYMSSMSYKQFALILSLSYAFILRYKSFDTLTLFIIFPLQATLCYCCCCCWCTSVCAYECVRYTARYVLSFAVFICMCVVSVYACTPDEVECFVQNLVFPARAFTYILRALLLLSKSTTNLVSMVSVWFWSLKQLLVCVHQKLLFVYFFKWKNFFFIRKIKPFNGVCIEK